MTPPPDARAGVDEVVLCVDERGRLTMDGRYTAEDLRRAFPKQYEAARRLGERLRAKEKCNARR